MVYLGITHITLDYKSGSQVLRLVPGSKVLADMMVDYHCEVLCIEESGYQVCDGCEGGQAYLPG
jgi:hypothetical protein